MKIYTVIVVDTTGDLHTERLFTSEENALRLYNEYITLPHTYSDTDTFKVSYGQVECD